jgi:ferredoxin
MHVYRDVDRLRTDFPVLISEGDSSTLPLREAIDRVIATAAGEGDVAELKKRWFLRLEAEIKTLARERPGDQMGSLLGDALARIEDGKSEGDSWRSEAVSEVGSGLPAAACVYPFASDTPAEILRSYGRMIEAERKRRFDARTEELVADLSNLLASDDAVQGEARSPEHLEAAIGEGYGEEIDFGALSDVLEEAPHAEPLKPERRARITRALEQIERCRTGLAPDIAVGDSEGGWGHMLEGFDRLQSNVEELAQLARALQTADLERAGRYTPPMHDGLLQKLGVDDLTDEDLALCPTQTVVLNSSDLSTQALGTLLEAMRGRYPLKVVLLVDRLYGEVSDGRIPSIDAALRLSLSIVPLQTAFVLQTTSSHLEQLTAGFEAGMRWPGPALFVVYTGSGESMAGIDPYLVAAAALESRAVPALQYEPVSGGLAASFSVSGNPSPDRVWSGDGAGENETHGPFTFAEFLATDRRFEDHFLGLAPEPVPPSIVPLSDYVDKPADGQVPVIRMADAGGNPVTVAVSADIVSATRRIAEFWKLVRELGGVENSYAERAVELERDRHSRELESRLEEAQREHDAELERTTSELAREIVANIAAGMLNIGETPASYVLQTPTRSTGPPSPAGDGTEEEVVTAPEAAVEEEEEEISFDDPFIETPRCTTCNECTNLNPRMFAYNENKQAYILDSTAGTYRELVKAAELCPVRIIHPGKPLDSNEDGLEALIERAKPFN